MTSATLTQRPATFFDDPLSAETTVPLGERLIAAGLITENDLAKALEKQRGSNVRLGEVLVDMGFVEEEKLLPFLALQLGIPWIHLRDGLVDPPIVPLIPKAAAESLDALALFRVRETLTVAMAEPQNLQQLDEIERITNLRVRPVLALRSDIERMIERGYRDGFEVDAITADLSDDAVQFDADEIKMDLARIDLLSEGSPIINLVNYIIVHAVRQGASDIHVEPGDKVSIVRYRVDGQLREVLRPRYEFHPAIVSRIKVMAKMDIAEHRIPLDGRIHVMVEGKQIDLRASTLPTVLGEKVVLRVLDRSSVTFNLDALGVPDHLLTTVKRMLRQPHGLLLVTGPTGSGKSTTLYSALELVKSVATNIVTVEDPVEYQLDQINQVQADSSSPMSFATALRAILRQDPDIIMVGEIRDAETAEVAIQAALTGHLVLSTLHTNDSASAITRLTDMGIAPYKIGAALVGVIAQRLVRRICPNCRAPFFPPQDVLDSLQYHGDRRRTFVRGEGCAHCHDSGFRGRTGIYEVLECDREMRSRITLESNVESIRQVHRDKGGLTLLDEGLRIAELGETSLDEILRVAFVE